MASLNVNDHLITIYKDTLNYVCNMDTCNTLNLSYEQSHNTNLNCSQDTYLGLVRHCSAISNNGNWYAVVKERNLIIWSTSNWAQKSIKILERAASKIFFTPSDNTIIVADKTGDVYSFCVNDDVNSKGILLMGHLSILLDITMTSDENFIITCDRDEKIRVTHYPNTYNIKSFCLGHSEFVTNILLLNDNILLSSSGDGSFKFWKFLEGTCIFTYHVNEDFKNIFSYDDINQCIITNIVTYNVNTDNIIICVSVHNFDGIFVYNCDCNLDFNVRFIQKINCYEPLDFVIHKELLWILNYSNSYLLNALMWNNSSNKFEKLIGSNINKILQIINDELLHKFGDTSVDLTVLSKKYNLKEKIKKKIKLY